MGRIKSEIVLLNVLMCILVIFIHVSSQPITTIDKNSVAYYIVFTLSRLSTFVVQGFILLSGVKFFIGKSENMNYKKYYISKFKNIVLPYILWVFIYYMYFYYRNYYTFSIIDFIKYVLNGTLVGHFYFIIAIIQFYLLAPLWQLFIRRINPVIGILVSAIIMILFSQFISAILGGALSELYKYNDRIFTTYLLYWVAGCYIGLYFDKFKSIIKSNRIFILVLFIIVLTMECVYPYLYFGRGEYNIFLDLLHIFYCIGTILFLYMVAFWICDKGFKIPALIYNINSQSYKIYLIHCLVIFVLDHRLEGFSMNMGIRYIFRLITTYIISIGICIAYGQAIKLVKKIK